MIVNVISVGHLSTTALAGSALGALTSNVTGYSIVLGFLSTLDTLLPAAWTSPQPNLVGLWSQRMGASIYLFVKPSVLKRCFLLAVLTIGLFIVGNHSYDMRSDIETIVF